MWTPARCCRWLADAGAEAENTLDALQRVGFKTSWLDRRIHEASLVSRDWPHGYRASNPLFSPLVEHGTCLRMLTIFIPRSMSI